jgi:hypothetical protein
VRPTKLNTSDKVSIAAMIVVAVVLMVLLILFTGYSGEGEHRFRREGERHSGVKVNSSRSEATLAW